MRSEYIFKIKNGSVRKKVNVGSVMPVLKTYFQLCEIYSETEREKMYILLRKKTLNQTLILVL